MEQNPKETYTFYVDESGDAGIQQVRSDTQGGASPYLTLGATLVRDNNGKALQKHLLDISSILGDKALHSKGLDHKKKVLFAQKMAEWPVLCFAAISHKDTLGDYKENIGNKHWLYYHRCLAYLLERLGCFLQRYDIPSERCRIVVENSNNIRLGTFRCYMRRCQAKAYYSQMRFLSRIDPNKISVMAKSDAPLLCLGDFVAHAVYQCVNKSQHNHGIVETRYVHELRSRFFANPETNAILGWGIKPIHSLNDLALDDAVRDFLLNLRKS